MGVGEGDAEGKPVRLWELEVREVTANYWRALGLSFAQGFVIRAESEEHARAMAAQGAGDEGAEVWLDDDLSYCHRLAHQGQACVVLRDFFYNG